MNPKCMNRKSIIRLDKLKMCVFLFKFYRNGPCSQTFPVEGAATSGQSMLPVNHSHLPLDGGVRVPLLPSGHHGQRTVQVLRITSAPQNQVLETQSALIIIGLNSC